MTNTKAIQILRKQIVKIEKDDFYTKSWIIQTNTYLSEFLVIYLSNQVFFILDIGIEKLLGRKLLSKKNQLP